MHRHCAAQLHAQNLGCNVIRKLYAPRAGVPPRLVARAKNNSQKNEGVYFEYEAVDPDAAEEIAALQEEDEEQFSWAQRSRDKKKAYQDKVRGFGAEGDSRRQRKGGKRGGRANDAAARERRQAAADAAAATASNGPVLPSFSPVETPAMRARATTPEELLMRPHDRPAAAAAGTDPQVARPAAGAGAAPATGEEVTSTSNRPEPDAAEVAADDSATQPAAGAGAGSNRRQRLLQRMKGDGGGAAAVAAAAAVGAASVAAAAAAEAPVSEGAAAEQRADEVGSAAAGSRGSAEAAGSGDQPATSTAAAVEVPGAGSGALRADPRSPLAALAAQLPPEGDLPPDAQQARALLAAILSPSVDDVRASTEGDVSDMLQRDRSAQAEFAEWLRRAAASAAPGAADGDAATVADDELSEAEAADLMAALANLDLEGDFGDLAADLGLDDGEGEDGGNEEDDDGGDAAVGTAVHQVSELRRLMAQLDADDDRGAMAEEPSSADMTDEQVLAALKASDPALYELLKDVPEFDKLDLNLDLDLDLESAAEKMTEEELAALEAEAAATAAAGGGDDEEAELDSLLRDMRGLGLMREGARNGGDDVADDDDDGEDDVIDDDDDDDDDALALGDLLEAIDQDEGLDSRSRLRAQFALQSMFNQPADELMAAGGKGGRGGGEEGEAAPPAPPPAAVPRGTTGMAREAVRPDDEDGGAAPPPMLPRPQPKPRSG